MLCRKRCLWALVWCVVLPHHAAAQQPGAFPGGFAQGRQLDAFGQAAGVPPGTLPLASPPSPSPPPRRSPVLGVRPAASAQGPEQTFGPPEPYQFQYSVSDVQSGAAFRQQENSDGRGIEGQYVVQLPDGRNQIVKYAATDETGFHAEVSYEGEPVFPPTPGGGGGGGGGGGRIGGGQQPRSLPPRTANVPVASAAPAGGFDGVSALAPPLATSGRQFSSGGGAAAAPSFGRQEGNFVAPRGGVLGGQALASGLNSGGFGNPQQGVGTFDGSSRGLANGGFEAAARGLPPGGFGNALEPASGLAAPSFGPTGAELAIPGGAAFGSFGGAAPAAGIGGRRPNHRG